MSGSPLRYMLFYDGGKGFRRIRTFESSVTDVNYDSAITYLRGQAIDWKTNCPDKFGTGRFVIARHRHDNVTFDECEQVCSA